MKFELFVAFRYLRARSKQSFISVVTLISVVGVAAGVMALNVALALNAGLIREFQDRILGATSHVHLVGAGQSPIVNYQRVLNETSQISTVLAVSPAVYGQALLVSDVRDKPAILKGVDPGLDGGSSRQIPRIIEGDLRSFGQPTGIPSVVLGKDLAQSLAVSVGENIRAMGLSGELSPMGRMPRIETFRVGAIFDSGLWEYDANWALITLSAAQQFLGFSTDEVSALEFRVKDIYKAQSVADRIGEVAGPGYVTNTWIELNGPLFSALELEKLAMIIAIGLIVLVASLNIVSTLNLMVMEKARDIAIVSAMGGTQQTIMAIFVLQGLIIGLVGTIVGDLLASVTVWYCDKYQVFPLEPQVYIIPYVPFELNLGDVILVSFLAVVISFLATVYPARAASRLDPVEALRYE